MFLIIFDHTLSCTNSLSEQLQDRKAGLAKRAELVLATIETLQEYRTEKSWNQLLAYAKSVADVKGIKCNENSDKQVQRLPRRLQDDVVVLESTGYRNSTNSGEDYKIEVYYPVVDRFIAEMECRFSSNNLGVMKAIQACSPTSKDFLNPDCLAPLVEYYNLNKDLVRMEAVLARRSLKNDVTSLSDVIRELYPLKNAFPCLINVLQIALTIGISTAECERSFSSLKRIKTYLRTKMSNDRLSNLARLAIEKQLSKQISLENIIQEFAAQDNNRQITLR